MVLQHEAADLLEILENLEILDPDRFTVYSCDTFGWEPEFKDLTDHESTKSRTEGERSVRGRRPSVLQAAQEPQVENLQLVVQLHADDAVVSVDAQQDPCGLAVLPQDHLHLENRTESAPPPVTMATAEEERGPGPVLVDSPCCSWSG